MIQPNEKSKSDWIKKVPNIITLLRVGIIPIIMIFLPYKQVWSDLLCAGFFAIGAITDGLDGYIARKYDAVSKLGKLLDPIADKMYVSSGLIMLLYVDRIHPWAVVILLTRDFAISGLRSVSLEDRIEIPVGMMGKWKTAVQLVGITGLMLWGTYLGLNCRIAGNVFIWISVLFSVFSAAQYFHRYFTVAQWD